MRNRISSSCAGSWPTRYVFSARNAASAASPPPPISPRPTSPVVGLDLDDRADEAAPVAAVGVTQRRLERNGDGRRTQIGYSHGVGARVLGCSGARVLEVRRCSVLKRATGARRSSRSGAWCHGSCASVPLRTRNSAFSAPFSTFSTSTLSTLSTPAPQHPSTLAPHLAPPSI